MPVYEDHEFENAARALRRLLGIEFEPRLTWLRSYSSSSIMG